jgi:hypothetical protein
MSKIIDFNHAASQLKIKTRLRKLMEAGLSPRDLSILYMAANRAFDSRAFSLKQLAEMGPENLKYLKVSTYEDGAGQVFTIGDDNHDVLVYTITTGHRMFDWQEHGSEGLNLAGLDNPGHEIEKFMLHKFHRLGIGPISTLGIFTLSAFVFSAMSEFNPINLQYFDETKSLGLVLYDPVRGIDLALATNLHQLAAEVITIINNVRSVDET